MYLYGEYMKNHFVGIGADHRGSAIAHVYSAKEGEYQLLRFAVLKRPDINFLILQMAECLEIIDVKHDALLICQDESLGKFLSRESKVKTEVPRFEQSAGLFFLFSSMNEERLKSVHPASLSSLQKEIKTLNQTFEQEPIISVGAIALIHSLGEAYGRFRTIQRKSMSAYQAGDDKLIRMDRYGIY